MMGIYYIGTKKENEMEIESKVKSFDTKEELVQYYKDVINNFDNVRFGKEVNNWVYWQEWREIKKYPVDLFEKVIGWRL